MARFGVVVAAPIARAVPVARTGVGGVRQRARVQWHFASVRALGIHARTRRVLATYPLLSQWRAVTVAHGTHRRAGGRRTREGCDPSRAGMTLSIRRRPEGQPAVRQRFSQIDVLRLLTMRNNPLIATCTMPYTTMAMMIGNTSVLPASVLGLPTMPRNGA